MSRCLLWAGVIWVVAVLSSARLLPSLHIPFSLTSCCRHLSLARTDRRQGSSMNFKAIFFSTRFMAPLSVGLVMVSSIGRAVQAAAQISLHVFSITGAAYLLHKVI